MGAGAQKAAFTFILLLLFFALSGIKVQAQYCGDDVCNPGEEGWCSDCFATPPPDTGYCGDGSCDPGEEGWCSDCFACVPSTPCSSLGCGSTDSCGTFCGSCPPPSCDEDFLNNYRCSGSNRQREKQLTDCTTQWVTIESCTYGCNPATATCNLCVPVTPCSALPCGSTDSCGAFCGACPPPPPVDNVPTATITVPASAIAGSSISISVTGSDDVDVAQLQLYDVDFNLLSTFECAGIQASCSNTFSAVVPSAAGASYTFRALSKDSAGQISSFVKGSGTTTAAPVVPPPVVPPSPLVAPAAVSAGLSRVSVKFPLHPLFMRFAGFDSECLSPGESALLAFSVQNTGRQTLSDVKFTATVPDLNVYASEGPMKLITKDKSTRFMFVDIPSDAPEGEYLLRLTASNNRFKRSVHRSFVVDSRC